MNVQEGYETNQKLKLINITQKKGGKSMCNLCTQYFQG